MGIVLVFDPLGSAEHRVNLGDTMAKKGSEYLIEPSKSMYSRVWEMRWDLYYLLFYIYTLCYFSVEKSLGHMSHDLVCVGGGHSLGRELCCSCSFAFL